MSREASMSEADTFRKSTREFWSKMEQKDSRVAARLERGRARSSQSASAGLSTPRSAAAALKAKKHRKR
jgi:hypothetical protein